MEYNVRKFDPRYDFVITGASYAGNPVSGTAMFISKKVEGLLKNLKNVENCLIFIESGMTPDEELFKKNCIHISDNPQREYAKFMTGFAQESFAEERQLKYELKEGYYIGEKVSIGDDSYIEPGCLIGHGVSIGAHCRIFGGAVIKNAIIGDNFVCNENAVIGTNGFTMAEDEKGDKFRIPTLGKVIIGNNVEIGQLNTVSVGSGGDTIIQDNVKLDGLVYVGHNANLAKNTEVAGGVIIPGFVNTGEDVYMGVNSSIRNRINIGANSVIGMGAVVTKSVPDNTTVIGNPAKKHTKER